MAPELNVIKLTLPLLFGRKPRLLRDQVRGSDMKLRIKVLKVGLHPNERIVSVNTTTGEEKIVVHQRSLLNDTLNIGGYPIDESDDYLLVELPRETLSGAWRVWVPKSEVLEVAA